MSTPTVDTPVLDPLDREILDELRADARLTWRELGLRVGLGPTAAADRVRRLRALEVLKGYHAEVDLSALGMGLRAITEIRLVRTAEPDAFEADLAATPEVLQAVHVTGALDYVLLLACADVPTLDRLLSRWRAEGLVEESATRIILREVDLAVG